MLCRSVPPANENIRIQIGNTNSDNNGYFKHQNAYNKIQTTKYTLLTFLPMNLLYQFRRFANIYFLLLAIVSFFLEDCPISPLSTLIPLVVVIAVALLKQIPEFYFRRKSDRSTNRRMVTVIRQGKKINIESQFINPGELVFLKCDTDVPCDLVLLQTSCPQGKCFITTSNVNGESKLKTLQLPKGMPKLELKDLPSLGQIECESATYDFYSFNGKLETINETISLTSDNILLSGTRIKHTDWIIGCAVYLGMDTKLQLNNKQRRHKIATSENYINNYVFGMIIFMIIVVFVIYLFERCDEISLVPLMTYLGPAINVNNAFQIFNEYFGFLVLFSYMIPILLYVILEVYRILGACYLRWDLKLYDEATDQPCIVHTSDLIEELGQINMLFCDKTGTITKNEMTLEKCSINERKYLHRGTYLEEIETEEVYSMNKFDTDQRNFFEGLAICHTVQSASKANEGTRSNFETSTNIETILDFTRTNFDYRTANPDEKALVDGCAKLGLIFLDDNDDILKLQFQVTETDYRDLYYKRLHVLEFTSERKRMSVIVTDQENTKWIYTKGADSSVLPLCVDNENEKSITTNSHITEFANEGLRTLVIARRRIEAEEYAEFLRLENLASTSISQRRELKEKSYALMESDLELLGATAVEDILQDDVALTLVSLRLAGIRVWILTGDKLETTLSVARSCGHITNETTQYMIVNCMKTNELITHLQKLEELINIVPNCALIIDNQSLDFALRELSMEFRDAAMKCRAVVCSRLNTLQKSHIVSLMRSSPKQNITAAVGDGANDIAMLQEAHVGIAVIGKEGREAVAGSDYAIAKFSMIKRLLLVHGHFNTSRLSLLILYYFYENMLLMGAVILFQFYAMHSGTSLYDYIFLAMYTTLYNILPAIVLCCTEKPYSEETLMKYPELYTRTTNYRLLSWPVFLLWTVDGFLHSAQIFCSTYFLFLNDVLLNVGQTAGLTCFGTIIMQSIVIVGNLKLWIESKYMTYWYLGALLFSMLIFMISTVIDNVVNNVNDSGIFWAYNNILSSLPIWIFTIVLTIACVLPDFALRYLRESFKLPKTWSFAQSGFVRTLQDYNILSSDELTER